MTTESGILECVISVDFDGIIQSYNEVAVACFFENQHQRRLQTWTGINLFDCICSEGLKNLLESMRKNEIPYNHASYWMGKSTATRAPMNGGTSITTWDIYRPLLNKQGVVYGVSASFIDTQAPILQQAGHEGKIQLARQLWPQITGSTQLIHELLSQNRVDIISLQLLEVSARNTADFVRHNVKNNQWYDGDTISEDQLLSTTTMLETNGTTETTATAVETATGSNHAFNNEKCLISALLKSIVDATRVLGEQRNITLEMESSEEVPVDVLVILPAQQIRKAFLTLLTNAYYYLSATGSHILCAVCESDNIPETSFQASDLTFMQADKRYLFISVRHYEYDTTRTPTMSTMMLNQQHQMPETRMNQKWAYANENGDSGRDNNTLLQSVQSIVRACQRDLHKIGGNLFVSWDSTGEGKEYTFAVPYQKCDEREIIAHVPRHNSKSKSKSKSGSGGSQDNVDGVHPNGITIPPLGAVGTRSGATIKSASTLTRASSPGSESMDKIQLRERGIIPPGIAIPRIPSPRTLSTINYLNAASFDFPVTPEAVQGVTGIAAAGISNNHHAMKQRIQHLMHGGGIGDAAEEEGDQCHTTTSHLPAVMEANLSHSSSSSGGGGQPDKAVASVAADTTIGTNAPAGNEYAFPTSFPSKSKSKERGVKHKHNDIRDMLVLHGGTNGSVDGSHLHDIHAVQLKLPRSYNTMNLAISDTGSDSDYSDDDSLPSSVADIPRRGNTSWKMFGSHSSSRDSTIVSKDILKDDHEHDDDDDARDRDGHDDYDGDKDVRPSDSSSAKKDVFHLESAFAQVIASQMRVLICDEDSETRKSLKKSLKLAGFTNILSACTYNEAVHIITAHARNSSPIHVLLMDFQLDDPAPWDCLSEITKQLTSPIVPSNFTGANNNAATSSHTGEVSQTTPPANAEPTAQIAGLSSNDITTITTNDDSVKPNTATNAGDAVCNYSCPAPLVVGMTTNRKVSHQLSEAVAAAKAERVRVNTERRKEVMNRNDAAVDTIRCLTTGATVVTRLETKPLSADSVKTLVIECAMERMLRLA